LKEIKERWLWFLQFCYPKPCVSILFSVFQLLVPLITDSACFNDFSKRNDQHESAFEQIERAHGWETSEFSQKEEWEEQEDEEGLETLSI